MSASPPLLPDLATLVGPFYENPEELGLFEQVEAEEIATPYRELLDHNAHMTVTMEDFHGGPVDVRVLATRHDGSLYSRKILLSRQYDGRVVMFGVPRLNLDVLSPEVRAEIESQRTPLGRVLINHNVLREVELIALWRVKIGGDLARLFGQTAGDIVYGRTALIHLNGEPAVELLEIAAPI